jgi:hypothetical protein
MPGKGAFLHLNGDVLGFVTSAVGAIYDVLTQEGTRDLNELLDNDQAENLFKQLKTELVDDDEQAEELRWSFTKDSFGKKIHKGIEWQGSEYRVTVILTSSDELKLDVRQWYDPNSSTRGRQA